MGTFFYHQRNAQAQRAGEIVSRALVATPRWKQCALLFATSFGNGMMEMELQWIFLALTLTTYSLIEALIPTTTYNNTTYDPEELLQRIFEPITIRAAGYGLIRFEEQSPYPNDTSGQDYGLVTFEGAKPLPDELRRPEDVPVKFEDSQLEPDGQDTDGAGAENVHASFGSNNNNNDGQVQRPEVNFEESSNQEGHQPQFASQKKKRRRRRRRKPRLQRPPFMPGVQEGLPQYAPGYQGLAPNTLSPGYPAAQFYSRGPPRVAPPVGALSTVTQALASIARHDDLQCVPRLLCEAAGGATSGATSGGAASESAPSKLLQSIAGLQPLLTLLLAGGLGGSPLLVFGRAVLLGTGGGGAVACAPAYPACPADPERLIHYLNNHNGGFFRFFNSPQPLQDLKNQQYPPPYSPDHYGPQGNLLNQPGVPDQQSYGLLQQPLGQIPNQLPGQQSYGLLQQPTGQIPGPQSYGLQQLPGNYLNQVTQQGYGLVNQQYPGLESGYAHQGFSNGNYKYDKYGLNYLNRKTKKDDKIPGKYRIEKRIQNIRPNELGTNQPTDTLFVAPEKDETIPISSYFKKLRFPDCSIGVHYLNQPDRSEKGFRFPGVQSNRQYFDEQQYDPNIKYNIDDYSTVHAGSGNNAQQYNDDREEIVYVVRGNGDPNHPEIVKLRPGQKLQK